MAIDWITVSAQIVNFLALVWLLKRFLYQPVLDAMDRREQRIADRLEEARQREEQAAQEQQSYTERREALERERGEVLSAAQAQAERERRERLEEVRSEIDELREGWREQVDREKEEFLDSLRRETAEGVRDIARRTLRELADADLEERMVHRFVEELKSLDDADRDALARAPGPLRVASAFALDSTSRGRITRAAHEHLNDRLEVEYLEAPDLVCGIEVRNGGRELSWTVADAMDALAEAMERRFGSGPAAREEG